MDDPDLQRERIEDIPLLAKHFLEDASNRLNCTKCQLTPEHIEPLQNYSWPGNVRELQNVIERAIITSCGGPLQLLQFVPETDRKQSSRPETADIPSNTRSLMSQDELNQLERNNILSALEHTNGKVSGPGGAAELLGIKPTTLASRIKKLGIQKTTSK